MADCQITFARSARKELQTLPTPFVQRIFPKIEALATNPQPKGYRKLKGEKHLYRIRVGDYWIIYAIYDDEHRIDIIAVRHPGLHMADGECHGAGFQVPGGFRGLPFPSPPHLFPPFQFLS